MFKKKQKNQKKDSFFSTQEKKLPDNFAEDLFHFEMEVESDNVSMENINSLLNLYAIGVEYYESIQHQRYLIFKNKTQQLLLRPNVMKAMNIAVIEQQQQKTLNAEETPKGQDSMSQISFENSLQDNHSAIMLQQKQREYELSLQYLKHQDIKGNIQQMFDAHKQGNESFNNVIHKDLNKQQDQILKKIEKRRSSKIQQQGFKQPSTYKSISQVWEKKNYKELTRSSKLQTYENPQENGDSVESLNSEGNEQFFGKDIYQMKKNVHDLIDLDLNSPEIINDLNKEQKSQQGVLKLDELKQEAEQNIKKLKQQIKKGFEEVKIEEISQSVENCSHQIQEQVIEFPDKIMKKKKIKKQVHKTIQPDLNQYYIPF